MTRKSSKTIRFPIFHSFAFQLEIDETPEDLDDVKSVFTVLGFTTKSSIASIKNAKKIDSLESEYAKIRSSKPDEVFSRFPALNHVDYFTPGMKAIMLEIVSRLAPKPQPNEIESMVKANVLKQAKKVRQC